MRSQVTGWLVLVCVCSSAQAGWQADIGYVALQNRLGDLLPRGQGIVVTQVEAPSGGSYLPDTDDSEFTGKAIFARSGASDPSSHATAVGRLYYGSATSLVPAVPIIYVYNADKWVNLGFLYSWTGSSPLTEFARVQNHSWIGTTSDDAIDADILRRIDLVIERDGVVVAAGVNNGTGSAVPKLLCSAYNVMAVGLTSGKSSYGPTRLDISGRVKPDLVAPSGQTSYATPMVASAAALMTEAVDDADALAGLAPQQRKTAKALLVRGLLLGGATKDEFPDWRKGFATPVTDGTVPLDYRYGAGELNVDNSHRILTAGEQEGGEALDVMLTGWDHGQAAAGTARQYFFEIPRFSYADSLSVLATWNRHITAEVGNPLVLTPSLADINLYLREVDGAAPDRQVDPSVSPIDNVEHLFLRGLGSGRYVIEVASDSDWDFVLTWDIHLAPTPPSDLDGDGDTDADDVAAFVACSTGPGAGPPAPECLGADLDGDADVDQTDFGRLQRCLAGPDRPPEPGCAE